MYKRLVMKNLHFSDINPRVCGMRACTPGFTVGPIIRDHWIVHYVLGGQGTFVSNGQSFELQSGDVFIVHPGDLTSYIASTHNPWEYVWAAFDLGEGLRPVIDQPVLKAPWAATLFSRIAASDQNPAPEWAVCALLHDFFATLVQQRKTFAKSSSSDYINRALNDIHFNYDQPLQIADLAASLGLDRHYFCRLFHQQMGMSPQAYLISYRLEKAAELLTVHHLPQKEAARLAGYADVAAFSKMFKRKYGVPPGAYCAAFSE